MRTSYFTWRALAAFRFRLTTYYFFSLHNGDVRQKQIKEIFLSEFKMGPKAIEMPCGMDNGFGTGTADEPSSGPILLRLHWKLPKNSARRTIVALHL